jgi:cysteinyl-tRNA synthetase
MDDDFNTPEAVAVLFDLANDLNKTRSAGQAQLMKSLAALLGLLQREAANFLQGELPSAGGLAADAIEAQIAARADAKKSRNFAEADRIRKALQDAGVILEDKPGGKTEWRRT